MRILYNTQGKSEENITIKKSNSLTNGSFIFSNTQSQNLNTIDLSSLETGVGMFWNSNLSTSTQDDIARTIKNHTDGNTHVIDLGINVDSSIVTTVEDRGWTVTMYELKVNGDDKYSGCLTLDDIKVVDGDYLTIDIKSGIWNEPLPDLTDGESMFKKCTALTTFNSNLSSLTHGNDMFDGCSQLTSFTSDLSSLWSGSQMFRNCSALTSFSSDLFNLEYANYTFYYCGNLTSFDSDLSSLRIGNSMFAGCKKLTTFKCNNLSFLQDGRSMFAFCENLTSFKYDLPRLTSAERMFQGCTKLTSFKSDLSRLEDGYWMFDDCKLDAASVKNIALTINKSVRNNPQIELGIDESIVNDAEVKKNIALIKHKGWIVYVNSQRVEDDSTDFKYSGCLNVDEVKVIDSNYTADIESGIWNEPLPDLTDGESMFYECTALTAFNSNLPNLNNGKDMFSKCSNLTTFDSHLFRLTHGDSMFYECTALTTFNSILNSLEDGQNMFYGCSNLTEFTSDLSCLNNAKDMFWGCCLGRKTVQNIAKTIKTFPVDDVESHDIHIGINISLKDDVKVNDALTEIRNRGWNVEVSYNVKPNTIKYALCTKPLNVSTVESNYKKVDVINGIWSEPLPNLTDGDDLFQQTFSLTTFNSDLNLLFKGRRMFWLCSNLTSFNGDLSSLEDGSQMFDNCKKLTSFTSDLCSLKDGKRMFYICTALTSFTSELHNLNDGSNMFYDCSNLTTFTSDLSSLTTGQNMFYGCSNLTTFTSDLCGGVVNLKSLATGKNMFENSGVITFNSDLKSLTDGVYMFKGCSSLKTFSKEDGTKIDLKALATGTQMFSNCSNLNEVNCELNALTTAGYMFSNCSSLTSFDADLSKLEYAGGMFEYSGIELFSNDMIEVTEAGRMFYCCSALTSFTSKLDNLKHGEYMFSGCTALTSFDVNISDVTDGHYMFSGCTSLTSFDGNLKSLKNGLYMFDGCSLDTSSVQHIADTINDLASKGLTGVIHIGHAEDVPSSILNESGKKLKEKGWTVYFNGVEWEEYGPYDVVKRWGYIPDASKWNEEIYIHNNLIITEITTNGEMINNE